MAKVSINIATHNIHGFNGSSHYLHDQCSKNPNSIICVQEHWLRPPFKNVKSINQIRVVHPSFDGYGVSGMRNESNESIRKGRPYGGTAFLFNKTFSPFLRPRVEYEHDRVSVMELLDSDGSILILNAYLPFRQSGDDHKVLYLETLGFIKSIIDANANSRFIILGDFNYNIFDLHFEMSKILRDFIKEYDLCCSHDTDTSFCKDGSFTRCCLKSGTYSLLDYVFFSRSLRDRVSECEILYDGSNPSDHFPVQIKLDVVVPLHPGDIGKIPNDPGKIIWSSLTDAELANYENVMADLLDKLQVPTGILHGDKLCSCDSHLVAVEHYFQSLVDVVAIADSFLPRKTPKGKGGKDFWSDSLTRMKTDSCDSYRDWQLAGRPSSGPIFERKKSCHYSYKAELRWQQRLCASRKSEALGQRLMGRDFISFWKDWRKVSQVKSPPVNRIGDAVTEPEIANTFKQFYQQIYGVNDTDAHRRLRCEFEDKFPGYFLSKCDDSLSPFYLTWDDMISISGKLKPGKGYNSFIRAEHILYGSPKLMPHIHILFNAMLQHSYVPSQFLHGSITPIVKDSKGDINAVENYRGITLCGVLSHMFENALRLKFGHFLGSDDLQFGFKPKHSTSHAVFTLKTCIDYFTSRDSSVYVALLDYSKAFDTISHSGLFIKLMERNVPLCFLLVIVFWYSLMNYECRWGQSCSDSFSVKCGSKQGGILSPDFFSVYINDLIKILRMMSIGCHILKYFIASILFADDMTLLAPTRNSMQQLLDVCADYCVKFCLKFNVNKTKMLVFGKMYAVTNSLATFCLNGDTIEYVDSCKYLGFHIRSGSKFKISVKEDLCGFFASASSILSCVARPRENVLIHLLYSNCVPKLTYGAAAKDLSSSEKQQLNVAVNNVVRRIFGFRRWESIRQIRDFYNFEPIEVIFAKAKRRFENTLICHNNHLLRFLSTLTV